MSQWWNQPSSPVKLHCLFPLIRLIALKKFLITTLITQYEVDAYYPYYLHYYYFTCYKEINVWRLTEENLLPGLLPAKAAAAWKLSAALPSAAAVPSRVKSENAAAAASWTTDPSWRLFFEAVAAELLSASWFLLFGLLQLLGDSRKAATAAAAAAAAADVSSRGSGGGVGGPSPIIPSREEGVDPDPGRRILSLFATGISSVPGSTWMLVRRYTTAELLPSCNFLNTTGQFFKLFTPLYECIYRFRVSKHWEMKSRSTLEHLAWFVKSHLPDKGRDFQDLNHAQCSTFTLSSPAAN